jgi:hypothetical protein
LPQNPWPLREVHRFSMSRLPCLIHRGCQCPRAFDCDNLLHYSGYRIRYQAYNHFAEVNACTVSNMCTLALMEGVVTLPSGTPLTNPSTKKSVSKYDSAGGTNGLFWLLAWAAEAKYLSAMVVSFTRNSQSSNTTHKKSIGTSPYFLAFF